jgi:hypothetical protein
MSRPSRRPHQGRQILNENQPKGTAYCAVHLTGKLAEMVLSEEDAYHRQRRKDEEGTGRKIGEKDLQEVSKGAVRSSGPRPLFTPRSASDLQRIWYGFRDRAPVRSVTAVVLEPPHDV